MFVAIKGTGLYSQRYRNTRQNEDTQVCLGLTYNTALDYSVQRSEAFVPVTGQPLQNSPKGIANPPGKEL